MVNLDAMEYSPPSRSVRRLCISLLALIVTVPTVRSFYPTHRCLLATTPAGSTGFRRVHHDGTSQHQCQKKPAGSPRTIRPGHHNDNYGTRRNAVERYLSLLPSTSSTSSTTAPSSTSTNMHSLNPMEAFCATHLDVLYSRSLSIKCPFLRRRTADFLDAADLVMRFLIIRHKSVPLIGPPPACRTWTTAIPRNGALATTTTTTAAATTHFKATGLTSDMLLEIIRGDWRPRTNKGYYLTGRLSTHIYRDDCLFDGPDPDMPVRGLRKYLNAASQLFETKQSKAELLDLKVVATDCENEDYEDEPSGWHSFLDPRQILRQIPAVLLSSEREEGSAGFVVVAEWRLQGVLHLPWHPKLPVWTGRTFYHFDKDHLVKRHEEEWDISVLQAFTRTLWPQLGNRIWQQQVQDDVAKVSAVGSNVGSD